MGPDENTLKCELNEDRRGLKSQSWDTTTFRSWEEVENQARDREGVS